MSPRSAEEILGLQQDLVREKAESLRGSTETEEGKRAACALALLGKACDLRPIRDAGGPILYADEYQARAEALVEARRLVGGVVLEKV